VGSIIKKVDDVFAVFIQDEAGRFFCLHLPFWGVAILITWAVALTLGIYLIWGAIVFGLIPFCAAGIFQGIYEAEQYNEKKTGLVVAAVVYVAAALTLIGVPGVRFGLLFTVIETKTFEAAYWWVVEGWWRVFHFYHDFKGTKAELNEMQDFVNGFSFHFSTWQWEFLVSAFAIAPLMYWWIHKKARERAWDEELENARLDRETEERVEQAKTKAREMAERQRLNEARRIKEAEVEKEKQSKIQEKINEVKGKDPWDSGFL
jgi:signal transduction histidine kinase